MNMRILLILSSLIILSSSRSMEQSDFIQAEPDTFESKFHTILADIALLQEVAREYEESGDAGAAFSAMQIISEMHDNLKGSIIARSANKWFLTGDTLSFKLRLKDVPTYDTLGGLCIKHSLKLKNPLHHLVSHNQVFNSCGFNSLANAYALERQSDEGLSITTSRTRAYAEYCFVTMLTRLPVFTSLLSDEGIEYADAVEIAEAAKALNLDLNIFFLSHAELDAFKDAATMASLTALIKEKQPVHFFINVVDHWVIVSVICQSNGYALYHLNSANDPIDTKLIKKVFRYIDGLIENAKK